MADLIKTLPAFALVFGALATTPSFADDTIASSADNTFWLSGSVGLMDITAREYVNGPGFKLSQLDWESKHVMLYSGTIGAEFAEDWTITAKFDFGAGGNGDMADYDWVPPYPTDNSKDGWSHRSLHPRTDLNHYLAGTLEIGRKVAVTDTGSLGISGGFKYTDVQWDARGGSYIYSSGGFRNDIGEFKDATVITYRQRIPSVFLGVNGSQSFDRLTLSAGVKGGLTFGINDVDDHWLRNTRFKGSMDAAPMMMIDASADYKVASNVSIFLAGSFENVFRADGDISSYERTSGTRSNTAGAAGASFQTMLIKFGLKGTF
jgi:outer membrane protease